MRRACPESTTYLAPHRLRPAPAVLRVHPAGGAGFRPRLRSPLTRGPFVLWRQAGGGSGPVAGAGQNYQRYDYATRYLVGFAPLPAFRELSEEEYQDKIAALIREIEQEGKIARAGNPVAGVEKIPGSCEAPGTSVWRTSVWQAAALAHGHGVRDQGHERHRRRGRVHRRRDRPGLTRSA